MTDIRISEVPMKCHSFAVNDFVCNSQIDLARKATYNVCALECAVHIDCRMFNGQNRDI